MIVPPCRAQHMHSVTGELLRTWKGHRINDLALTGDGRHLLATPAGESCVRIYQLDGEGEAAVLGTHSIISICLAADSRHLLVCWPHSQTGHCTATLALSGAPETRSTNRPLPTRATCWCPAASAAAYLVDLVRVGRLRPPKARIRIVAVERFAPVAALILERWTLLRRWSARCLIRRVVLPLLRATART